MKDQDITALVVEQSIATYKLLPADKRADYLQALATFAISAMHGTFGKEFTAGYLRAARASLDDPTTIRLAEPRQH